MRSRICTVRSSEAADRLSKGAEDPTECSVRRILLLLLLGSPLLGLPIIALQAIPRASYSVPREGAFDCGVR